MICGIIRGGKDGGRLDGVELLEVGGIICLVDVPQIDGDGYPGENAEDGDDEISSTKVKSSRLVIIFASLFMVFFTICFLLFI